MGNFLVLFSCLGLGILFRRFRCLPANAPETLNRLVLYVPLPALALTTLHAMPLGPGALAPAAMAWVLFLGGFVTIAALGNYFRWSRPKIGALILTAGLGNTSFVGYPLLEALLGPTAMPAAIVADQAGSFLVVGTLGIVVASLYGTSGQLSVRRLVKKIIVFPPFFAVVLGFALRPIPFPAGVDALLIKLSAILVPLALLSVGLQLKLDRRHLAREWPATAAGLVYKFCVGPGIVVAFYLTVFPMKGMAWEVTVLQSAMAPMITSAILAAEYELDAELANLMVGVGVPLSLLTVPLTARLFF